MVSSSGAWGSKSRGWELLGVAGRGIGASGLEASGPIVFTTQVSLLLPPWDEFTINDPAAFATRVRPPGATKESVGPSRVNGRRST